MGEPSRNTQQHLDQTQEEKTKPKSLKDHLSFSMGDRISYSKPIKPPVQPISQKHYTPKTQQTRTAYSQFLNQIRPWLGDQPQDVWQDAMNQILATLKTEDTLHQDKYQQLKLLFPDLSMDGFTKLLNLSKQLVDFTSPVQVLQKDTQIAIQFKDQDQPDIKFTVQQIQKQDQVDSNIIPIEDLDRNWLFRILSERFPTQEVTSKLANILNILQNSSVRQSQNNLIMVLGIPNSDLVTKLLMNSFNILMTTKYFNSNQETKVGLVQQLKQTDQGRKVLSILQVHSDLPQPMRVLDLKSIQQQEDTVTKTKKTPSLPTNSTRQSFPGYQQITIPAPEHPRSRASLIRVPDPLKMAYPGLKDFNPIQSKVFPVALGSDQNLLICAPTGAGKTNIAIMAIMKLALNFNLADFKIVYIAPMKALVAQVCGNLSGRLQEYGIQVKELTGDINLNKYQIQQTQIIVTTPQKWDIITRKAGGKVFLKKVKLMIIDQIHLLHDMRGPILEAIIARSLKSSKSFQHPIRIVALSATLPNYQDVAEFLQVKHSGLFYFDKSWRPVPLTQQYIGITQKNAMKKMVLLNQILYTKVLQQVQKQNQVLIFVHSRKDTFRTAKALIDMSVSRQDQSIFMDENSSQLANQIQLQNPDLKQLIKTGFGSHHAGMTRNDRSLIQDLFGDQRIKVLVSTATLAWGVNLPAHTVIIKGTQVYSPQKGSWIQISPQDVLQMIGRAGRIDFDTEGEGIIITTQSKLPFYLSLLNTQLPIQSQMIQSLSDHLNAEIVLGSISSLTDAVHWFKSLYLYIRLLKEKTLYGYNSKVYSTIDQYIVDLVYSASVYLDTHQMITYNKTEGSLQSTALGQTASHFYLKPESISTYNSQLQSNYNKIDLLRVFSLSYQFKYIPVRLEEKVQVAKLMERVPYPIKGAQDEPASKMNALLQAYISKLRLEGFSLMADMVYISQSAGRIMRALFQICIRKSWAQLSYAALQFSKLIKHRMWGVMTPLRQFHRLSEDLLVKIEKKQGILWENFLDMREQQMIALFKSQKAGQEIYKLMRKFPRLELNTFVQPITRSSLRIQLALIKNFEWDTQIHNYSQLFWIFVEDLDSEVILHYEQFLLKYKYCEEEHLVTFIVPLFEPLPPHYFIRVVSDQWISAQNLLPVDFKYLILPQKNYPPSKVETQEFNIEKLGWPALERILGVQKFNLIQSSVIEAVFNSDQSVLITAPTGSGLQDISFIAAIKGVIQGKKVLYITQFKQRIQYIERMWKEKLQKLDQSYGVLSGNLTEDLKILNQQSLVLGTSREVESISRRWRRIIDFQQIEVVIIDQCQMLGESDFEVCLSRIRYMATEIEKEVRIVCLGFSVSTAKDLADWLGISTRNFFNFLPEERPIPLKITVCPFDHNERYSRIQSMISKLYSTIKASEGPCVIFVSEQKTAQLVISQLLETLQTDNFKFEIDNSLQLPELVRSGLLFLHEGLDSDTFYSLSEFMPYVFATIATASVALKSNFVCQTSIVLDTCKYDGIEHKYIDYQIPLLLSMVYLPTYFPATALVYCHTPKRDYLQKFLQQSYPLQSQLDHSLQQYFNSQIATQTITNKQDTIDWITWTFYYRRLVKNPNFYNLQGTSGDHINDFLSEIVQNNLQELQKLEFIEIDDMELSRLNLGIIAARYNLKVNTIDTFAKSVTPSAKVRGIIEILVSANQIEEIPVRAGQNKVLNQINQKLPQPLAISHLNQPRSKALLLLQSHLSRLSLTPELYTDLKFVLKKCVPILSSLIDVISTQAFLFPVLYTLRVSQMITQALWDTDSTLKQLPYITSEIIEKCLEYQVSDIVDLMNMEDDLRSFVLKSLDLEQISQIAKVCNTYPNIDIEFQAQEVVKTQQESVVVVKLSRQEERDCVYAPFFSEFKEEMISVIVGSPASNVLLAIRSVKLEDEGVFQLTYVAPQPGVHNLSLYLLSDSYLGSDQVETFQITVLDK